MTPLTEAQALREQLAELQARLERYEAPRAPAHNALDPAIIERMVAMRSAGEGVVEIAAACGVSQCTVSKYTAGYSPRENSWTPERVEKLHALYVEGLTCSQIAARLGGVSRNSVIGKLNRIGLSRKRENRYTKVSKNGVNLPKRARKPKPSGPLVERTNNGVPVPLVPPEPIGGHGAPLLDLARHQCRWPTGHDGEQHLFCGADRAPGSPYCAAHAAMARADVQPDAPKRPDAFVPSWRAA